MVALTTAARTTAPGPRSGIYSAPFIALSSASEVEYK